MMPPEHISGITTHARRGRVRHAFRYGVDMVLIDPETRGGPALFSRNRFNLSAVHDRNHGGPRGQGRGVEWAREVFARTGLQSTQVLLLTQPSYLGHVFNPVSFWLAMEGGELRAVIAEVNNTFGDRHSYLCHKPAFAAIDGRDRLSAEKIFHVSPFQQVEGQYHFNFDVRADRIAIRILHENGDEGVIATLAGPRHRLTNAGILWSGLRRPAWALRVLVLIHWQALRLKLKGAPFRPRPVPPQQEVS